MELHTYIKGFKIVHKKVSERQESVKLSSYKIRQSNKRKHQATNQILSEIDRKESRKLERKKQRLKAKLDKGRISAIDYKVAIAAL